MGLPVRQEPTHGEVVEWLMALVLKTSEVRASVGSNPTLSVPKAQSLTGLFSDLQSWRGVLALGVTAAV